MTKIEQIKKLLFGDMPPVAPVALATDYTLADGSVVSIDKLEVGGIVTVAGIPATEGEYVLMDGTLLEVGVNGVLTEVTLPMQPGVPPMDAAAAPVDYSKQFSELSAKIQGLKDKFENDLKVATGKLAKQNTILKEIFSVVEAMSILPVSTPVDVQPGKFSKQAATDERLKNLQENLKRIKNL